MLNSPSLWQCPVCRADAEKPTSRCLRCGCNLLLLAKIKIESWLAIARAEEAKSRFLFALPPVVQEVPSLSAPLVELPIEKKKVSLLRKLRSYIFKEKKHKV